MTPASILRELENLSLTDKLFVIERTLKSIRTEKTRSLKAAVDSLHEDYKTDAELTAFTTLDAAAYVADGSAELEHLGNYDISEATLGDAGEVHGSNGWVTGDYPTTRSASYLKQL